MVRIARTRVGLSQRDLARAAHVPQSTIARIESGSRQPSLPVLARILAAADLELRVTLEPYSSHDDFYDAEASKLTAGELSARQDGQARFAARLRVGDGALESGA
ncbi:MAG: XRE family transcriptional regulator [Mycobacterium sp.]|nr:MAG: XRE family transcriptional regulator [Mycobacterium sp.]